jgi:drug/metabolite transporter (DMT)-like permease
VNPSTPSPSRRVLGSRPTLDLLTLALVAWSITMSVSAQLLLRSGMGDLGDLSGIALYVEAARNWQVPGGILAYGLGTLTWLVVLSRLDLAAAYPLGSFNYVLVTILSAAVLGESVPALRWAGTALILAGILVIAAGERRATAPDDVEEPGP